MQLTTPAVAPASVLGVTAMDIPAPSQLDAEPPTGSVASKAGPDSKLARLLRAPTADLVDGARTVLDAAAAVAVEPGASPHTFDALRTASASLEQASMLVQLVNRSARNTNLSPELELNLINAATGLAAATGDVMPAAASISEPTTVGELVPEPIASARAALDVVLDHVQRSERQTDGTSPGGYL